MSDEHCAHCLDHEGRLSILERREIVRDAALTFVRWALPILVATAAVLVAVTR